jgi:hypothetical protein
MLLHVINVNQYRLAKKHKVPMILDIDDLVSQYAYNEEESSSYYEEPESSSYYEEESSW